jgi:hypothetical protein
MSIVIAGPLSLELFLGYITHRLFGSVFDPRHKAAIKSKVHTTLRLQNRRTFCVFRYVDVTAVVRVMGSADQSNCLVFMMGVVSATWFLSP